MAKVQGINMEIEARRGAFEALMDNASDACFDEKGNVIVKIGSAKLDLLEIDEKYQGDRLHKRTNKLANNWDWRKYDMITVVPHPETCTLSVVDGQNRTNAARIKGIAKLPVKIVLGVSDNQEERLKQEALMFVKQDEHVDKLTAVEKHKALLISGDKAATDLQKVLDRFGVSYMNSKGMQRSRTIGSYTMIP